VTLLIAAAALALGRVVFPFAWLSGEYPHCVNRDPQLPDVLLIGDSTQIRYFPYVVSALEGTANVCRVVELAPQRLHSLIYRGPLLQPVNARSTEFAKSRLEKWLGDKSWDVIHANWGLHDSGSPEFVALRSGDPDRQAAEYKSNLGTLMDTLINTKARVIFGLTTPLPESCLGGVTPDPIKLLNDVAVELASSNGVKVNDLYSVVHQRQCELQASHDVHFNEQGSRLLGAAVASSVLLALADSGVEP